MQMGPGNMTPVRIDLHTLIRYWLVSPFTCAVLAVLILAAFWYFQATLDAAEQEQHWPAGRTLAFVCGLVGVELAFQSSVAMLPYISFPMQVIQKLLLLVVAPPLLVVGAPLALALETSRPRTRDRLLGVLESAPVRVLSHPAATFLLYFLGLLAYYLTSAVSISMRHVWVLNLVNLGFLAVGVLFWWSVLGVEATARPRHAGTELVMVGAGIVVQLGLGIALLTRTTPVAPIYTLADTHTGGAILLACTVLASVAAGGALLLEWYRGGDIFDDGVGPSAGEASQLSPPLPMSPPG
jgi:putative copper resistance protein D